MHILFLPGAGGAADFWHPLGAMLPVEWEKTYLSWPGAGNQPQDPAVRGIDDWVTLAESKVRGPTVVVAQSMGGIVGIRLAFRLPEQITHLVLVATSGGIDVTGLGCADWRASYAASFPEAASWITEDKPDYSGEVAGIACPTLLLWGDQDPISPPAVGLRLMELISASRLEIIRGGNHHLGHERAGEVAPLIIGHISKLR